MPDRIEIVRTYSGEKFYPRVQHIDGESYATVEIQTVGQPLFSRMIPKHDIIAIRDVLDRCIGEWK